MNKTAFFSAAITTAVATTLGFTGVQERQVVVGKVVVTAATQVKVERKLPAAPSFQIVKTKEKLSLTSRERRCMAMNAYHEAGVEGIKGMLAVLQVTHSRQKSKRWGDTMCKVVYHKAQFSWTLSKKAPQANPGKTDDPTGPLMKAALSAVELYENGSRIAGLGDAMYYHTDYIDTPYWVDEAHKVGAIGRHIFYSKAKVNVIARPTHSV